MTKAPDIADIARGLAPFSGAIHERSGDVFCYFAGFNLSEFARRLAAQADAAIQPQRVPDGFVLVPQAALDWLFGEAPGPDGRWFGDREEIDGETTSKFYRRYWWRSKFRSMIPALTRPKLSPTEKIEDGQS